MPVRPEPWIDPGNPEAWRRYGQALLDGGRYEDALVGFERAVELAPAGVKAWTGKAETLFGLRRYDEALAAYERAIELDPKDVDNWKGKERALLALDRHEEALAANERAVEPTPERSGDRDHQGLRPVRQPWIDPGNPEAWRRYGQALLDGGRYEDALVGFERAVELGADDVVTWRLTGHALRGLGRPEEALAAYERAIDKDPGNLDTLRLRSQILSGLGRAEEAGAAYSAEWRPVALGQPQPPTARDADIPSTAERASPSSPPPGTRVTSDLPSRPLSTGGAQVPTQGSPLALGQPQPPTARDADIPSTAERASPSSPPPGTRVTPDLPSRSLSTDRTQPSTQGSPEVLTSNLAKKIRVYELARELGLTNKEGLDLCLAMGIGVSAHSSIIEDAQADRVRRKAERDGLKRSHLGQPQPPTPDSPATHPAPVRRPVHISKEAIARRGGGTTSGDSSTGLPPDGPARVFIDDLMAVPIPALAGVRTMTLGYLRKHLAEFLSALALCDWHWSLCIRPMKETRPSRPNPNTMGIQNTSEADAARARFRREGASGDLLGVWVTRNPTSRVSWTDEESAVLGSFGCDRLGGGDSWVGKWLLPQPESFRLFARRICSLLKSLFDLDPNEPLLVSMKYLPSANDPNNEPQISGAAPTAPMDEMGSAIATLGGTMARRPVRIRKEAIDRRGGGTAFGDSSTGLPPDGPARVFIDGRCSVCGRFFDGGIERTAFRFVSHQCGGREANDEWRFDR